jgi:hypothetical protein
MRMDFQKHYHFIFIDDLLEEIVGAFKVFFLHTSFHFLCTHLRSVSINNAEKLHFCFVGYYQLNCAPERSQKVSSAVLTRILGSI